MASTDVADLLFRFQQIQADDHDILMNRFCELIQGANQDSAQFYLESFNWNLQAAVNAWFEYGGVVSLPRAKFIDDVTIGEGQSVPPSNEFTKTWAIQNNGHTPWPAGCRLEYINGRKLAGPNSVEVPELQAGETTQVSVNMMSPEETGLYESRWSLVTERGAHFGDTIWCIIPVEEGGTLAVTQMIERL